MLQGMISGIINAYIFSTLFFLLCAAWLPSFRKRTAAFLDVSNKLLLLPLCLQFVCWIKDTAVPFFTPQDAGAWRVHSLYSYLYLLSVPVLGFAFQLLFFWRRYRIQKWATVISVVLLLLLSTMELLMAVYVSFHSDYLPASWKFYAPAYREIAVTSGLSAVYFLLCRAAAKKQSVE